MLHSIGMKGYSADFVGAIKIAQTGATFLSSGDGRAGGASGRNGQDSKETGGRVNVAPRGGHHGVDWRHPCHSWRPWRFALVFPSGPAVVQFRGPFPATPYRNLP